MKLGFIGAGVVGYATARAFVEFVEEVRIYDVVREKATHSLEETLSTDLIFVCLPTPQKKDSLECDTSTIVEFFSLAASYHANANFVIRSTVPVGFTRRMIKEFGLPNLVHSPEFLTARCALVDAQMPSRNIIGERPMKDLMGLGFVITPHPWTNCAKMLRDLYLQRWPHVPILLMTSDGSEAVKLIQNSYFAVKVAFFNEANAFCSHQELDWNIIHDAILADGRIHPSHTQVPGPDGKFGYGGECLPKDLASLMWQMYLVSDGATKPGFPFITEAANRRNQIDRERQR